MQTLNNFSAIKKNTQKSVYLSRRLLCIKLNSEQSVPINSGTPSPVQTVKVYFP